VGDRLRLIDPHGVVHEGIASARADSESSWFTCCEVDEGYVTSRTRVIYAKGVLRATELPLACVLCLTALARC